MRRGTASAALLIGLVLGYSAFWSTPARGDGGTLRAWKRQGDYDIAVFTAPTPFVTGPVDISVLLLDLQTGEPVPDGRTTVEVTPAGRADLATRHPATTEAATNKLLRAAVFELREPGRCEVTVHIDGPKGPARIQFALDVGNPWTPRAGVWPWILWPFPVIVLYGFHRRLVGRSGRSNHEISHL